MKDTITEVELELEYSKAVEIIQEWAKAAKFTAYESRNKRVLYAHNRPISTTE